MWFESNAFTLFASTTYFVRDESVDIIQNWRKHQTWRHKRRNPKCLRSGYCNICIFFVLQITQLQLKNKGERNLVIRMTSTFYNWHWVITMWPLRSLLVKTIDRYWNLNLWLRTKLVNKYGMCKKSKDYVPVFQHSHAQLDNWISKKPQRFSPSWRLSRWFGEKSLKTSSFVGRRLASNGWPRSFLMRL